ncbi:MAG: efflux RND transporter permease subunit [Bacteroidales bacterium]|nr:efflux RND transporter permease subunit [Bacteroidales bacterium]
MKFILHRKIFISMLFLGLSVLGYISYKHLAVELMPSSELQTLFVQISSRMEVEPNYLENQAVIPVEGAIGTLDGVEDISSRITNRQATITVSFKSDINTQLAYMKLDERINQIRQNLDENFTVQVVQANTLETTNDFMELQIRGSGGTDRVRNIVDEEIANQLENIDGIAAMNVYGGQEKSVEVIYDKDACEAYNISPAQISSAIGQFAQSRTFTGHAHEPDRRYFVHITAEYGSVGDIENIVLKEGPILLKDVADVYFGVKEVTSYSRVNGLDAVSATLVSDSESNLIDLSHRTLEQIEVLNQKLKSRDVEIVVQSNSAETMETNINQIIQLALFGGLLAIFILWVFLKNLRLVAFVALAIPISIFSAFNFFYALGITINSFTLIGMAMAIGMLLDNSVVVMENIYRLSGNGFNPEKAVTQGANEVWRSILAATLTTITVFLPFIFASDENIRLIGNNVGISVISTIGMSLFVALLLIPMGSHFLLRRKKAHNIFYEKVTTNNRIIQIYVLLLKQSLRNPAATIIGALVVFFITILVVLALSVNNLSEVEEEQFDIYVTMPTGATLESTDAVVRELEARLEDLEEKKEIVTRVEEEEATVTVVLKENYKDIAKRGMAEVKSAVEEELGRRIGTGQISLTESSSGGSAMAAMGGGGMSSNFSSFVGIGTNQERIVIKGEDFSVMQGVAEDLEYYLEDLESIRSVSTTVSTNRPEVHLEFNQLLLTEYGLALNDISSELNTFSSEFTAGVTFSQGDEEYDITIKEKDADEEEEDEKTLFELQTLQVGNDNTGYYMLQDLADIYYAEGMSNITRENQEKQIEVTYRFEEEAEELKDILEAYRLEIDQIVAAYNLPAGIAVEVIHEEDLYSEYYVLIIAALVFIFMILASVFESLMTPFVILFSIPMAAIGSFLALIFTNNSILNANTITGFLILLGVVVNNGIILIDYTNILRKRGYGHSRALITAGISRVRPILITAITTIVAMFPLAMGQGGYVSIIGAPFAITVIGGLAVSTLLTLVFIPTMYFGLENALKWMKSLNWKIRTIHAIIFVIGVLFIYFEVDTFIWQLADFILLLILIPGVTYFLMTSLRRARTKLIGDNDPISINIRKIVKVYDRDSRFAREWKGGIRVRQRAGLEKKYNKLYDFYDLMWQVPMTGFIAYFIFFFIESSFWMFLLSHAIYFLLFAIWKPFQAVLANLAAKTGKPLYLKISSILTKIIMWGTPLVFLYIFSKRWDTMGVVIFVGVIWMFCLIIYATSKYLYEKKVNIDRITGRFGGLRRGFLRMIKQIPVIGKRKIPFRALNGASMTIGTGMFGLLGPNGAGKTTLMRIICGIYEQSYGKIFINGLDTQKYREELQGLMGYLPQAFGAYENMSAWEYLDYQAVLKGISEKETREARIDYVLKSVHMYEKKDDKIGSYSGGMKQRIGIAQILLNFPRILVVDEPTAGLDPRERIRFRNLLVDLSRERIVIFSTHIIEDISSSCNKVAVLNKGVLKYAGTPKGMAKLGENFVWTFSMTLKEFEEFANKQLIVHHMREGNRIKVRCISVEKPHPEAEQAHPLLEDAYLCLLKDIA